MPTAEATQLAACAAAMREERDRYNLQPCVGGFGVWLIGGLHPAFLGPRTECRAWIDQRAFAAGLRKLAESEPTMGMVQATGDLRAMLWALLAGDEG